MILASVLAFQFAGFYRTLVPHSSNANAFEEYVRVADLLNTPRYFVFFKQEPVCPDLPANKSFRISSSKQLLETDAETQSPESIALALRLTGLSVRDYCILEESSFGSALDLIHSGNQKRYTPPNMQSDELYDVRRLFEAIPDLELRASYAAFAEGHCGLAVAYLEDALQFIDNISRPDAVGVSFDAVPILDFLIKRVDQLGFQDATSLASCLKTLLSRPPIFIDGIEKQLADWPTNIENYAKANAPGLPLLAQQLLVLPEDQRSSTFSAAKEIAEKAAELVREHYAQPENTWPERLGGLFEAPPSGTESLAYKLAYETRPKASPAAAELILNLRSKFALALGHCMISCYRLDHGGLPDRIDDLGARFPVEARSGKPFKYTKLSDQKYSLESALLPGANADQSKSKASGP